MPCIVEPHITKTEYLAKMLCKVCKLLSKEQIQSVEGEDVYIDLQQWYLEHLLQDAAGNEDSPKEQELAIKEAARIDAIIKKEDGCWVLYPNHGIKTIQI